MNIISKKQFKKQPKKQLTAEERLNVMIEQFNKESKERLKYRKSRTHERENMKNKLR